jgi:hypothetical protein
MSIEIGSVQKIIQERLSFRSTVPAVTFDYLIIFRYVYTCAIYTELRVFFCYFCISLYFSLGAFDVSKCNI